MYGVPIVVCFLVTNVWAYAASAACVERSASIIKAPVDSLQSASSEDSEVTFNILSERGSGSLATSVCRGASYRVVATYPNSEYRKGVLTTTLGTFEGADVGCHDRQHFAAEAATSQWNARLFIPCEAADELTVTLKAISVSASGSAAKSASVSVPLAASCCSASECCAPSCKLQGGRASCLAAITSVCFMSLLSRLSCEIARWTGTCVIESSALLQHSTSCAPVL